MTAANIITSAPWIVSKAQRSYPNISIESAARSCLNNRGCTVYIFKPGSQYDAGRCVASRHASLKCCRNAMQRDDAGIEPNNN